MAWSRSLSVMRWKRAEHLYTGEEGMRRTLGCLTGLAAVDFCGGERYRQRIRPERGKQSSTGKGEAHSRSPFSHGRGTRAIPIELSEVLRRTAQKEVG